jgi:hypothetical protein
MGNFLITKKKVDSDTAFNTLLKNFVLDYAKNKCDKALFPFQPCVGLDRDMVSAKFGASFFDGETFSVKTILDAICCSTECRVSPNHWDPIYSGWQKEQKIQEEEITGYPMSGCQVKADIENYCVPLGYEFV